MTFDGRVLLITGATGGLGRVVTSVGAADGARLVLAGSNEGRLRALGAELGLPEERLATAVGDLGQADAARAAVGLAVERFGRLDIVVHAVGGWIGGKPIVEIEPTDLERMLAQHVWSTFHVLQAAVPVMIGAGWGRFVAVSSPAGRDPTSRSAPYSAAKAGQEALVTALAREVATTGVTANVIVVKAIDAEHERERAPSPKNAAWVTPEEITATIRWLCTDDAGTVNGQRLVLTAGGRS
ncbi:MAG TPA: SDR family NAD(P)-dependent oxidoreductase [Candidatus Limnocylindrales bacterium]|nr:SDR family NAD(P)-dependent oxidoreductase [Candidatus Limnocylindrales bacterium]